MSQVTEPALVDYARFYGLTLDHLESKYHRVLATALVLCDSSRKICVRGGTKATRYNPTPTPKIEF